MKDSNPTSIPRDTTAMKRRATERGSARSARNDAVGMDPARQRGRVCNEALWLSRSGALARERSYDACCGRAHDRLARLADCAQHVQCGTVARDRCANRSADDGSDRAVVTRTVSRRRDRRVGRCGARESDADLDALTVDGWLLTVGEAALCQR